VRSVSGKATVCLQKDLIALCDATTVWKELLSVLGNVHLHQLCNVAEQDLLSSIKTVIRATADIDTIDDLEASRQAGNIIRKSFGILEALSLGTWSPKFSSIFESLKWMVDALSLHSDLSAEDVNQSPHIRYAAESIYYILRLSVLLKHSDTALKLHGSELSSFLSTICTLLGLPSLQHFPDLLQFSFDFLIFFSDDLTDDQRAQLSRLEAQRHNSDPRLAFIFGPASSQSSQESWLGLVTSASTPPSGGSNGAPSSTPTSTPASSVTQRFQQQHTPGTPRPMTASSQVQGQQPPARAPTPLGAGRPTGVQAQQKMWNSPVPFPLRRWEVLPDAGGGAAAGAGGNDTSVSLALFGARRVG
jgi:mediator of RNA polymerase II transcription subunit 12